MSNARDKANIPSLNFSSTGIDDNATSTAITIDSNENIGIGETSPTSHIHLKSGGNTTVRFQGNVGGSLSTLLLSHPSTADAGLQFNSNQLNMFSYSDIAFFPDQANISGSYPNGEKMRIRHNGNVGIGTSSPTGKLNIATAATDGVNTLFGANVSPTAAGMYVGFNDSDATATLGVYYSANPYPIINITRSDRTIKFMNDATERMRIDSSGQVGIGTTSPNRQLTIAGGTNTGLQICGNGTGTGSGDGVLMFVRDSDDGFVLNQKENSFVSFETNNIERMRILSNGRIGINRTSVNGAAKLDISHPGSSEYGLTLDSSNTSGTQYHLDIRRGGVQAGYLTSNSATTVVLNNASDERLKENIQNSNSAIEDLKNIQVRQFDWKDGIDTHRDFGFVAQELVNVVPEAVTRGTDTLDENGKPVQSWGVDYSHIVPRLVKVCQEQQTKIEDLEARITALKTNQP